MQPKNKYVVPKYMPGAGSAYFITMIEIHGDIWKLTINVLSSGADTEAVLDRNCTAMVC